MHIPVGLYPHLEEKSIMGTVGSTARHVSRIDLSKMTDKEHVDVCLSPIKSDFSV